MLIPLGFLAGSGGVESDYELIETYVLGTAQASVVFSGLGTYSSTYKHLQIRYTSRGDVDSGTIFASFNGVGGTSYAAHRLLADGSSVSSLASSSRANTFFGTNGSSDNSASIFAAGVIDILDFASTTKNKTTRSLSGLSGNAVRSAILTSGLFNSTAAITSISLSGNLGNLVTGSRFSLYGIRG
jgi:hypothetical protein